MIFAMLLPAVVCAAALALIGWRFELQKPAIAATLLGIAGAVLFVIGLNGPTGAPVEEAQVPALGLLGMAMSFLAVTALLCLAILKAYRHWSGYDRKGRR